jgi:hypothetical protein
MEGNVSLAWPGWLVMSRLSHTAAVRQPANQQKSVIAHSHAERSNETSTLGAKLEPVYDSEAECDHSKRVRQQGLLVNNMAAPNPKIAVRASRTPATTFQAEDCTDNRFFIFGTLGNGVLRFEVVRRLTTGEHSTITGREFFDAMMAHFGARVRIIEGNWNNANPERLSNLIRFNQVTANPSVPLETAALVATRTGQWADDLVYSTVTFVTLDPPLTDPKARGNFTQVVVHFSN